MTTQRMGENTCNQVSDKGLVFSIKNSYNLIIKRQLNLKMALHLNTDFLHERYINGQ